MEKLHKLLSALFKLGPEDGDKISEVEFGRRLSSGALLTAVALKPFSEQANHWAVVSAWVMFSLYTIGFSEKYGRSDKLVDQCLDMAGETILDSLTALMIEVHQRKGRYRQGNGLADFPVRGWRYTLLMALGSIYWLERERTGRWVDNELKSKLEAFLPSAQDQMVLWGEGAIPQFIFHEWYTKRHKLKPQDDLIIGLASQIMNKPLFCAYYSAEAIRHELADTFDAFRSEITQTLGDEARYSYFSEALMVHLAQRDLKQACQTIWGRYSRMTSSSFH